jgi:2'-5' RNA ligase
MRLFIAVDIDDKVRQAAGALARELAAAGADVKWVEPENMHLTLAFLGDLKEEHLAPIHNAMQEAARGERHLELVFDRLGAFGAPSHPRVVWLGVSTGAKALTDLTAKLRTKLTENGIALADEHEFSAHLTLGRVKSPDHVKELLEKMKTAKVPAGLSCRSDMLVLYRSSLSSAGSMYEGLRAEPLG